jgi:hypothetical protein
VPSAEAQCARAWPRRGLACQSDYPSADCLLCPPRLLSPQLDPSPLCVPQGFNTGVLSPSAPATCCSGSSPEFRYRRGPSVLSAAPAAALGFCSGASARSGQAPHRHSANRHSSNRARRVKLQGLRRAVFVSQRGVCGGACQGQLVLGFGVGVGVPLLGPPGNGCRAGLCSYADRLGAAGSTSAGSRPRRCWSSGSRSSWQWEGHYAEAARSGGDCKGKGKGKGKMQAAAADEDAAWELEDKEQGAARGCWIYGQQQQLRRLFQFRRRRASSQQQTCQQQSLPAPARGCWGIWHQLLVVFSFLIRGDARKIPAVCPPVVAACGWRVVMPIPGV